MTVADRAGKLYLDPNQNDYADTVAAAYSVRPFKHPNISAPIEWKELTQKLSPESFSIGNMAARLKKKGDLFLPVLDKKIGIKNDKLLRSFL